VEDDVELASGYRRVDRLGVAEVDLEELDLGVDSLQGQAGAGRRRLAGAAVATSNK